MEEEIVVEEFANQTSPSAPKAQQSPPPTQSITSTPCCTIDRELLSLTSSVNAYQPQTHPIKIIEALKLSDYIAYHIDTMSQSYQTKKRYSEFEALRTLLERKYPTRLVPPIPEKHGLGERKDDQRIIQKRKRLLQIFLNRIAAHPVIGRDHVFHQFLEGSLGWNEIVSANGLVHLLKRSSGTLSKLVERTILKNHDPQFLSAEDYTFRFSHQITLSHRVSKRIAKSYSDTASVESDLGRRYNAWSLVDSDMSSDIERMGAVFDAIGLSSATLARGLDEKVVEFLQEYVTFAKVVEKLLKYRHKKHGEWESLTDQIASKQSSLDKWEASELESQRISAVLSAEGSTRPPPSSTTPSSILATLNSFIDNDPELTRRNNISKTRDALATLVVAEREAREELGRVNRDVQGDLDAFQERKVRDLKAILLAFAREMQEFHEGCLEAWK